MNPLWDHGEGVPSAGVRLGLMTRLTAPLSFHLMGLHATHQAGPVRHAGGCLQLPGPHHRQGPPILADAQTLYCHRAGNMILKRVSVESRDRRLQTDTVWILRNCTEILSLSPAVAPQLSSRSHMKDLKHHLEPEQLEAVWPTLKLTTVVTCHQPGMVTAWSPTPGTAG